MNISAPVIVDADASLSKAVFLIRSSGVGVLVMRNKEYAGMIDERQLASAPKDTSKAKCFKYAVKTPILSPNMPILKIVEAFFAGRFKTLPIIEGTKVLGTVSRWDVLAELSGSGLLSGHKVSQYMTSPVVTVERTVSVGKAKSLMREKNIRRLLVTENGKIEGLVSFFDLSRLSFAPPTHVPEMKAKIGDEKRPIASLMRANVETIAKDAPLSEAVRKMLSTQVAALVVSDGLLPIGILTSKDVLEAVMRNESEGKVFISGIHGFEESAEEVYEECAKFTGKLDKSLAVEALNMHVKKTGRQYFVSAHIHGKANLLASASGWSLEEAVGKTLAELGSQAIKARTKRLDARNKRN